MNYRIVADSAADLLTLEGVPFAAAPLKVITSEKEFLDDQSLDVAQMVDFLKTHKGKSTSSCPNPDEWLQAFGDAQYVFGVAITSGLSGSYNAAQVAKQLYEAEHPGRRVCIVDSLSAGPGELLLVEKLRELILSGMDFDSICEEITAYQEKTQLLFVLQSLTNFANNGRVSSAVAKIAGLLGICMVGRASDAGTLELLHKCRGMGKALEAMLQHMKDSGFCGGKVRIAHCFNKCDGVVLNEKLLAQFPEADIQIYPTGGLCSFYAEKGGILIGYETV